jgi:hypothetical protein
MELSYPQVFHLKNFLINIQSLMKPDLKIKTPKTTKSLFFFSFS